MADINFYALLGLDPSIRDRDQIEKVIERSRKEWVRWTGNPVREGDANRNLGLLPRIRKVLLESEYESERQSHADAFRKLNEGDTQKLDEKIKLEALGKSQIPESQFKELVTHLTKSFKNKFSEQQIRDRCRQLGIAVVADATSEAEAEFLDSVTYRDIATNLSVAGEKDLYSLLGVSFGTTDLPKLLAAADAKAKEARLRPTQAEWTAKGVLAGHCLALFKDESLRRRYDRTATHHHFKQVLDEDLEQAGRDGVLTKPEWDHLLKKAREGGISEDIATDYISKWLQRRVGGSKNSKEFDQYIDAANKSIDGNKLSDAQDALNRAKALIPDHSEVAAVEERIRRHQDRVKSEAELRGAISANKCERDIVRAANRWRSLTDKSLAPSDAQRVSDAQTRVELLDRFAGCPAESTQAEDEAFLSRWEQSPDATDTLNRSGDPECRKLVKTLAEVERRFRQVQALQKAVADADRSESKEANLGTIASSLPNGYRHSMEARLAMSEVLLRLPPDDAAKADAWLKLKSSGYDVQRCYFRVDCEELARSHAARVVLEPLLAVENEANDRRYLSVWDEHGFASAQMEMRFEKRMESARMNVMILDQLQKTAMNSTATLTDEFAITKTADRLPRGYVFELAPRVELAWALVTKPPLEVKIANAWEKIRDRPWKPVAQETIKRCEVAIHRRDTVAKLQTIALGVEAAFDRQFVAHWKESELDDVTEAIALKAEYAKATVRVAILEEFEQLAVARTVGLKGEPRWIEANRRLPNDYHHPWNARVDLACALTESPSSESRIADCWEKVTGSKGQPSDEAVAGRCLLAVRRNIAMKQLIALDRATAPLDERDKTFAEVWDTKLFEGCVEADRWREEAEESVRRGREWNELERVLDEGVDCRKIKRLAASTRLKHDYPARARRKEEIETAIRRANLVEQLQTGIRDGREDENFAAFEASGMIRANKLLDFYWPDLGEFVAHWWQSRVKLASADRAFVLSQDRKQVHVSWKFTDAGLGVTFELATSFEKHFSDLHADEVRGRTQSMTPAELAAIGGRVSLAAPVGGQSLFVTVWAVAHCGKHDLVSQPLQIGPITSGPDVRKQGRKTSLKGFLWKLLNH